MSEAMRSITRVTLLGADEMHLHVRFRPFADITQQVR